MNRRHILSSAGALALLLTAERAACQAAPVQYEYRASWVAAASPEPVSVEVENNSWARLFTFRPERAFVLGAPLIEAGKSKVRLDAGTVMVSMNDAPLFGRMLTIAAPANGTVTVSLTAYPEDLPVWL